jgi:hypothetical protein
MRSLIVMAVLAATLALGGCLNHSQVYTAEALPPPLPISTSACAPGGVAIFPLKLSLLGCGLSTVLG